MKNKTFYNVAVGVLLQISVALSGILIPKLILQYYGSTLNGMVVSINQLISYLALVESGVGAIGIVALYRPLIQKDQKGVNAIVSAVDKLYKKSGLLYLVIVLAAGVVYPYMISGQIDSVLATSMFYVLSVSNLVDYLFLGKYKVLLTADEKIYVVNTIQMVSNVLNMVLSFICIYGGCSLLLVKSINIGICVARLLVTKFYVQKNYPLLSLQEQPDYSQMGERWDSLIHQIAAVVVGNTDVLLITIMMGATSLREVSVYSAYNMVLVTISGLFGTFSASIQAHFGKLFVSDKKKLTAHYALLEKIFFGILAIIFSCTGILLLEFISLYTESVSDVNYYRPLVAVLFVVNGLVQNLRIPGVTLICAAGKFRETRNRAIAEAVINIAISIALIPFFGIVGALLGTTASYLYRTTDVIFYSNRLLEDYSLLKTAKHILFAAVGFGLSCGLMIFVNGFLPSGGWLQWLLKGVIDAGIAVVVTAGTLFVLDKDLRRKEVLK